MNAEEAFTKSNHFLKMRTQKFYEREVQNAIMTAVSLGQFMCFFLVPCDIQQDYLEECAVRDKYKIRFNHDRGKLNCAIEWKDPQKS